MRVTHQEWRLIPSCVPKAIICRRRLWRRAQIPLNPPLTKGDFKEVAVFSPFLKGGLGGIFMPGSDNPEVTDVSLASAQARRFVTIDCDFRFTAGAVNESICREGKGTRCSSSHSSRLSPEANSSSARWGGLVSSTTASAVTRQTGQPGRPGGTWPWSTRR